MQITSTMQSAFNAQLTREVQAAYNYLSMSAWLESASFPGAAAWMALQSEEEWAHAKRILRFVLDRGGIVELGALEAPVSTYDSFLDAFRAALDQERVVSAAINDLYAAALEENDFASVPILDWFVNEQIEEEATVGQIVEDLERAGDDSQALLLLDRELGTRTPA